jgi:hypothetical protein
LYALRRDSARTVQQMKDSHAAAMKIAEGEVARLSAEVARLKAIIWPELTESTEPPTGG